MFKSLRIRLTAMYAALAGVVLLAVCLICLDDYASESRKAFASAFESAANAVIYKLQSDQSVSQAWLSQIENDARQIISIEDGGVRLSYKGSWKPLTPRDTLISIANNKANDIGLTLRLGALTPVGVSFEIEGEKNDKYLARVTIIPDTAQNTVKVTMLRDLSPEYASIRSRRITTFLWALAGLAALLVTGFVYSRHAVKPAQESYTKQVEFTAMASHELKTPLSVLSASVDALKTYPQHPLALPILENISNESVRMARLVDDLLILARSDAGSWKNAFSPVDMDTLLIETLERFAPAFASRDIALELELPDESLPNAYGDADRLEQILSVFLDNAMTYTPAKGRVKLCASYSGAKLLVSVSDDGPGVSQEDVSRIFDRFYRSDKAHADPRHFGLGLSVASELARLHSGKIIYKRVNPHGACFTLVLPAMRAGEAT